MAKSKEPIEPSFDNDVVPLSPREKFAAKIGRLQDVEQNTVEALARTQFLYPRKRPEPKPEPEKLPSHKKRGNHGASQRRYRPTPDYSAGQLSQDVEQGRK